MNIDAYRLYTPKYDACGNESARDIWSYVVSTWMRDKRELVRHVTLWNNTKLKL